MSIVATASTAMKLARTHLNDEQGSLWSDFKLFPKVQAAYREMMNELEVNDIPLLNAVTAVLTVPAQTVDDNNLDMSTVSGYPTDILEPIWMKERAVGQMNADFVDMTKVDFIPNITLGTELIWWCWIDDTIMLRGALNSTQVQIRYKRYIQPPNFINDSLIVPLSETFLGPEAAYMAMISTPNFNEKSADALKSLAERNLDNIVREAVMQMQNLPAKRRPYHRGRGRSRAIRDF